MKLLMSLRKRSNILAICSGGGHLTELMHSIDESFSKDVVYVTCKTPYTEKTLVNYRHYFIIDPHVSKFKYFINLLQSIMYILIIRPKIVISTGAGIAIPAFIIGKIIGAKLIFIETGARVITPSKTGLLLYKYADLFLIQHDAMLNVFPAAIIGGVF